MKIWVNGHEWAKQQARKIGLAFTELSNGFASGAGSRGAAADLRRAAARHDQRVLPALAVPAAAAAGCRTTRKRGTGGNCRWPRWRCPAPSCSPQPRHARAFFEALVTDNLDLGRPDTIEIIFGRRIINGKQRATGGTFKTKVITRGTEVTINAFYRHSRIKQYLKDGRALRIETVINSPTDLRIGRAPAQPGRTAGRRACDQRPAAAH